MENEREALLWGAMLHDIGKFKQRTEAPEKGVQHDEIGGLEVERFVPQELLPKVRMLVAGHHSKNTQDPLLKIAQIADRLSAAEREEIKEGQKEQYREKYGTLEASLLENPLSNLKFEGEQNEPVCFPLLPLESKNIMKQMKQQEKGTKEEYKKLWEEFLEEAKAIHEVEAKSRLSFSILYYLMEKYTWCIPSATAKSGKVPDISLFDHCKLSAALAVCLYDAGLAKDMERLKEIEEAKEGKEEQKEALALIAGDISGIQKFIFRTGQGTKGGLSAKRLRGRSFMLKLIADAVVSRIMQELSLPEPCLLFCAGGRFTILAPNTEKTNQVVDSVLKDANASLIKKYGGAITINIAAIPIKVNEITKFQDVLREKVGPAIEKSKTWKYYLLLSDKKLRDEIEGYGSKANKCPVCSLPMAAEKEYKYKIWEDGKEAEKTENMCQNCYDETKLGEEIGKMQVRPHRRLYYWQTDWKSNPAAIAPLEGFELAVAFERPAAGSKILVLVNESPSLIEKNVWMGADSVRFETAGTYWWMKDGKPATYEEMAKENGAGYLGWLKIDVDNLSSIFDGKHEITKTLSLSRYCFLSRVLEYFFKAGINELMGSCDSLSDSLPKPFAGQTIYAGGDDALVVGSWDQIVPLAIKISKSFGDFSGHSGISLSAGVAITPSKYPIGFAVEEAERNLDKAKSIGERGEKKTKKRGIGIFDDALQFEKKEGEVGDWIEKLVGEIRTIDSLLPAAQEDEKKTGFLRRLLQIKKECLEAEKPKSGKSVYVSHRHVPKIHYYLARQYKSEKEKMEKMRELLLNERFYSHLEVALSIKLLLLRKKGAKGGSSG